MKKILERGKDISAKVIAGVKRAIDPPSGTETKPLDIRRLVLEEAENQVQPVGGGRRALPGALLRVRVLVGDATAQKAMALGLSDIRKDVAARLKELRCDVPAGFDVVVTYSRQRPPTWNDGQTVDVRLESGKGHNPKHMPKPERTTGPAIELTILRGKAQKRAYTLESTRIKIGRGSEPIDQLGRTKYNDVVFIDDSTPENQTVTRVHASIRFDPKAGELRIFDEGSANGTVIIRNMQEIEVHRRDPMGTVILDGDEIRLGRAAIRVAIAG